MISSPRNSRAHWLPRNNMERVGAVCETENISAAQKREQNKNGMYLILML